jgi:hypothetical protein
MLHYPTLSMTALNQLGRHSICCHSQTRSSESAWLLRNADGELLLGFADPFQLTSKLGPKRASTLRHGIWVPRRPGRALARHEESMRAMESVLDGAKAAGILPGRRLSPKPSASIRARS